MKEIADITDVVELWIWAENKAMTVGDVREALEAGIEVSELSDDDTEDDWSQDMAQEVIDEMASRKARLGAVYPFEGDGNRVWLETEDADSSTYIFCVGLSAFPSDEIENEQRGLQFENVAMRAAGNFFKGETLRIGAPWRTAQIDTYGALLDRVEELIPDLGPKRRSEAPDGGDAGWDFLIVKGFGDGEFPRLIAFGNCATGRTDWLKKGDESHLGLFFSYFSHHHRSVVIELFAVPFTMNTEDRLKKCGLTTLTLDRHRICEHSPVLDADCAEWLSDSREMAASLALV